MNLFNIQLLRVGDHCRVWLGGGCIRIGLIECIDIPGNRVLIDFPGHATEWFAVNRLCS